MSDQVKVEVEKTIEISCREVCREVSAYIDGDVDAQLRSRLEYHFRRCKHCRAVLHGTLNTLQLIGDEKVFEVPSGFGQRLFANLQKRIQEGRT